MMFHLVMIFVNGSLNFIANKDKTGGPIPFIWTFAQKRRRPGLRDVFIFFTPAEFIKIKSDFYVRTESVYWDSAIGSLNNL